MEAFATHPRIGERHAAASATSLSWSAMEQSAADGGAANEAKRLVAGNLAYETKFGRTFSDLCDGADEGGHSGGTGAKDGTDGSGRDDRSGGTAEGRLRSCGCGRWMRGE